MFCRQAGMGMVTNVVLHVSAIFQYARCLSAVILVLLTVLLGCIHFTEEETGTQEH